MVTTIKKNNLILINKIYMKKSNKIIITTFLITIIVLFTWLWYEGNIKGGIIKNAPFTSILSGLLMVLGIISITTAIKKMWKLFVFILIPFIFTGCQYAKSNQKVLISNDCGKTWTELSAGENVPYGTTNPCFIKILIPNYPLQGDASFLCNLSGKVRVKAIFDYDYSIINAKKFISSAKYIGNANTNADDQSGLNTTQFETAENMVIDKRLKEVSKSLLLEQDIVEMEQSEIEDQIKNETNKMLADLGVELNFITLVFELDDQTRQAIDVATAMKIYESRNLKELGEKVITSRAGAARLDVKATNETKQQ